MRGWKRWAVFAALATPMLLAFALVFRIFWRHPCAASLTGAALVLGGTAVLVKRRLTLRLAPRRVAERRLEHYLRRENDVHFFGFTSPEDEDSPDLLFRAEIRHRDGLRSLELSDLRPPQAAAWIKENPGTEVVASFVEGTTGAWLIGELETPEDGEVRFRVRSVRLSGRSREFSP